LEAGSPPRKMSSSPRIPVLTTVGFLRLAIY
jgi:hypothetical protein